MLFGKKMHVFSLIFNKEIERFCTEKEYVYNSWIKIIQQVIGYENLNSEYTFLKDCLGSGKFGEVRLALHNQSNKKVAIKIISKEGLSNNNSQSLRNEREILKISQHPNIVQIYNILENRSYIYIGIYCFKIDYIYVMGVLFLLVMEFCEGLNLFSNFEKRKFSIKEEQACNLVHQLAKAVSYLHEYNIIHRDLKLENILTTNNDDYTIIKLIDFGLSTIIPPNWSCVDSVGTIVKINPKYLKLLINI